MQKLSFALPSSTSKGFSEYLKKICEISITLDNNQNFENDISFSIYRGTRGTNMNTLSIGYTNNE